MHRIILSIGTNVNCEHNIRLAKERLAEIINEIQFTEILLTEPIGEIRNEDKFVNFLAYGFTGIRREHFVSRLKQIETECGNTKHLRDIGKIAMDIDLLKYDEQYFHKSDWKRDYIIELMKHIEK